MKRIVLATGNRGKVAELRALTRHTAFEVVPMSDLGPPVEVVEDAPTFTGNAEKKAVTVAAALGEAALADDSGLEVDALDGRPGVRSARYGGPGLDDAGRYELLLEELASVPTDHRTARFQCAIAYCPAPGAPPRCFAGTLEGRIAAAAAGEHGFGYDPVFIPQGHDRTLAELGPDIKGSISHRARALAAFVTWLEKGGSNQ